MNRITSPQNERVKAAIKLRDRKGRENQRRIAIDGTREIQRALNVGVEFLEVFTCESLISTPEAANLIAQIDQLAQTDQANFERLEVSEAVWEKLTFGNRRDGIFVVAKPPIKTLGNLPTRENAFFVVLDGVEKPGNVGAVVRTADGAGVDAVLLTNAGTDTFNPNAIRASLGTIFSVPVVACAANEAVDWLREHNVAVHVSIVDEETANYTNVDYRGAVALVFGSEANGVQEIWKSGFKAIHLPMRGIGDSLNVSVATAAVLFEVVRQRS